jgi:hypothetical protein
MEPVPELVRQAALRAFDLRVPGAKIADLVFDPLIDDEDLAEPAQRDRVLRFSTDGQRVVLTVSPGQKGLRLTLLLRPARVARVELRNTTDSWLFSTDESGRLRVEGVPSGLISFVVRDDDEPPVQTAWVRL